MTIEELIEQLQALAGPNDPENAHILADDLLLAYINDPRVIEAWDAIKKWYA